MSGLFITLEGIDGCGKSTQAARLKDFLTRAGWQVVHTREPGGTELGQALREIFLSKRDSDGSLIADVLLMGADRAEHVDRVIRPALEAGRAVVCERYTDSTWAYQGFGANAPAEVMDAIGKVNDLATRGVMPDVTFLLDIDPELAQARRTRQKDRIEARDLDFHRSVRAGYLRLLEKNESRMIRIDASGSVDDVHREIAAHLEAILRSRGAVEEGGGR